MTLTDTLIYNGTKSIAAIKCFYTSVGSLFNHGKVHRVVKGRLVSLPENIGLGWMLMTLTDMLIYNGSKSIAAIKCFTQGGNCLS